MSPEKAARLATNQLMVAFKEASPNDPSESDMLKAFGQHRASSGRLYLLKSASFDAINRAVRYVSPFIDEYPLQRCDDHLKSIVVEEKDTGTPLSQAHSRMVAKVLEFLRSFQSQGEWEVVHAIRGVDPNEGSFNVGPCRFYLMDNQQFGIWGRRFSSGRYDPPPNAPLFQQWLLDEAAMRDQFVASARIRAINHEHAKAKGRSRLEEAINLLRYGQLIVGFPESPFPEVGYWVRQAYHDHSFAIQLDHPNFGTSRSLGGPIGNSHTMSRKAPGWVGLEQMLSLNLYSRSEMQLRLTSALRWIGQAALAPTAAIRLVALVTSLEALLIEHSESIGKRTKLSGRISKLVADTEAERESRRADADKVYRLRSKCVHGGLMDLDPSELPKAVRIIAGTIDAILSKPAFSAASRLRDILAVIEKPSASSDDTRHRWISENAYLRWVNEGRPGNRSLQHWFDAEREFVLTPILKGQPLSSLVQRRQPTEDEDDG